MKPIPVLNGSEYRERATMNRHVKENKAGMNSGTWNTAQKKKITSNRSGDRRWVQEEHIRGTWVTQAVERRLQLRS